MRKKDLELILENIPSYSKPKLYLEQYTTPSSIAADMVWEAYIRGDVKDKVVIDLGCGTGRLAIASLLLGAKTVICLDIDSEIMNHLHSFIMQRIGINDIDTSFIELIVSDASRNSIRRADTVIQNPPFGIRSTTKDVDFLRTAFNIANKVYSLHRSNEDSRIYLKNFAENHGFKAYIIKVYDFPIPQVHERHRRRIYYIKVDYWLFTRSER